MRHGIDAYFDGLERQHRRVASIGVAVLLTFLGGEFALRQPAVRAALDLPKRFGFEGPEQYARRILLEPLGEVDQPGASAQTVIPIELHAGGGEAKRKPKSSGTIPGGKLHVPGLGTDDETLVSRMRALALEGPVIRSEDLIVERLVRPEYPEQARAENIDGIVELVALVDTTGSVIEIHIVGGSREPLLEQAASSAALQSRYRPYRVNEAAQRVWAYFRVRFTLY